MARASTIRGKRLVKSLPGRGDALTSGNHLKMSETFAAAHASRNIIETVSLCDETMFTSTCALQLNSPRHNKRLMGGGCYSCRVVPLVIFHVSPDDERILI